VAAGNPRSDTRQRPELGHDQHTVSVFAPVLYLTVTVESGGNGVDEVHIHPGGQGFWVARMLKHLGERPLLSGPVGGEAGQVFLGLFRQWGIDMSPIRIAAGTPVILQDRRSGEREIIAATPQPSLERHELDDSYGRFLERALTSGVSVITGQSEQLIPLQTYRRLGHDLAAAGIAVVADLHGPELWEFLEGGPIRILKVSHEDLERDGLLQESAGDEESLDVIDDLVAAGAESVVLSRQSRSALARFGTTRYVATPPELAEADFRGAGDSMTAGLAASVRRGLDPVDTLKLACAAGAANVTRHGLGSADEDLIPRLIERVEVRGRTMSR